MSYQIKPLGYGQVAVLFNGKHMKKFGGVNALQQAQEFIETQHKQSLPKARPAGFGAKQVVDEMFNINSNIVNFDESMLEQFSVDELNDMIEKYIGFEKLSDELKAKGAKDPDALAAYIGRKKYGKKKFQKMSEGNNDWEPEKETKEPEAPEDAELKKAAKKNKEALDKIGSAFSKLKVESVNVGDTVSFHHELKSVPGHKVKASGTVEKITNDILHVKVKGKGKLGVVRRQIKMQDLVNENSELKVDEDLTEATNMGKWMQTHDELEDNNEHSKNMLRVAKLVGNPQEQKIMKGIYDRHMKSGFGISKEDHELRTELHNRLWPKVQQMHDDWKASKGIKEGADSLGNEGEFKKAKETFKAAKKQVKQGNPAGSLEVTESTIDHNHPDYRYKRGQQVNIRKEWQDEGDDAYDWHVAEDQDSRGGRVVIKSSGTKNWKIQPTHIVTPNMIEPHIKVQESFASSLFDGETISESIDIGLTKEDQTYAAILKTLMESVGATAISDFETDEDVSNLMSAVDEYFNNSDFSCVVENYLRNDVEERIAAHRKLGNKVSTASYSTKQGKPYAEFEVTTPEGVKKRYVFHGNVTRHETLGNA